MPEATAEEVKKIVHEYLDDVEVDDKLKEAEPIRFLVQDDSIRRTTYSWRVHVRPSREPRRWHYLYDELAEVGVDISDKTGLNIFFTTLDPASGQGVAA